MTNTANSPENHNEAWSEFWEHNSGATAGGCLPQQWAAIEEAQKSIWSSFADRIPQKGAVLDLATGDGRVLRWMREMQDDLGLTGIDLAPTLPQAPEGTETMGGVAMEALPFEDDSFDAVVSQFGFEYSNVGKVAAEIARVLKPGGSVGLMVHRGDGPILEHNISRREAIDWAVNQKTVGQTARTALNSPDGGAEIAEQVMAALALLGAHNFGQNSPAWEIPEAMRRAIAMGRSEGTTSVIATLKAIEAQANNELGRIASLQRACKTADDRTALAGAFSAHGLALRSTTPVEESSGRAFADFLIFE